MKVVLLIGSSTAGKSSLCKELMTEHKWESMSADDVSRKIDIERSEFFKIEILKVLRKKGLIANLQSLMTEEEIYKLCGTGMLTISKGEHKITESQFSDPSLPGLESVLNNAGFDESEALEISKTLRLVSQVEDEQLKHKMDDMYPPQIEVARLYDEAFSKDSKSTIVLDVAPGEDGNVKSLINNFEARAQKYRDLNPDAPLTTHVAFAFCSPQKLSERILERNRKADEANDPMNKRVGLDPLSQLASLVTAENKITDSPKNNFSRDELFTLVSQHANTDRIGDSLFLENPVDPEILQQSHDEKIQVVTTTKSGAVKLHPDSDADQLQAFDKPRIGSKKTIEEYGKLANRFGFFENQERASLNIRAGLSFDAIIDTGSGKSAAVLANELVEKLEKPQISSHRVSKL